MTSELAQSYRRALRWYPKNWRIRNEDVVLGTLLDVAEGDDRSEPVKGELTHLRSSGIRARFEFLGRIYPASIRDRAAAIAIGTGFAMAAWSMAFTVVATPIIKETLWLGTPGPRQTFGPFTSLAVFLYALWILAFVSSLFGWRRVTRWILFASLLAGVVARFGSEFVGMSWFPSSSNVGLLAMFALLGLVGASRPTRRWRVWTAVSGSIGLLVFTGMLWSQQRFPNSNSLPDFERGLFLNQSSDWMSWLMVGFVAALVICLVSAQWRWAAVTVITAAPWVGLYVALGMRVADRYADQAAFTAVGLVAAATLAGFLLHRSGYRITITRIRG